jgi:hypothetical protein
MGLYAFNDSISPALFLGLGKESKTILPCVPADSIFMPAI